MIQVSVITAMYNAAPYLPDLVDALEAQSLDHALFEWIVVDDGSDDGSVELLEDLVADTDLDVRILRQDHAHQSAARNLALDHAVGEWVTFIDADDRVSTDYLSRLVEFVVEAREAGYPLEVAVARLLQWYPERRKSVNTHPLRYRHEFGAVIIDLEHDPSFYHLHAGTLFISRELIERNTTRFDTRIYPSFEDAHFVASAMQSAEQQLMGFVPEARYHQRRRVDSSSQITWKHPNRFDAIVRYGHIDLAKTWLERCGSVPLWVQGSILYDIAWTLSNNDRVNSQTDWLSDEQRLTYTELVTELYQLMGDEGLWKIYCPHATARMRCALAAAGGQLYTHVDSYFLANSRNSGGQQIVNVRTRQPISHPEELRVSTGGEEVPTTYIGGRASLFYGGIGFYQYRWLVEPVSTPLSVTLRGVELAPVDNLTPQFPEVLPSPAKVWKQPAAVDFPTAAENTYRKARYVAGASMRRLKQSDAARAARKQLRDWVDEFGWAIPDPLQHQLEKRISAWPSKQGISDFDTFWRYGRRTKAHGAWVLYDSFERAGDNAEHLTRYLLKHRPDITCFYLLRRTSPDWNRLEAEGFPLLPVGSVAARTAINSAKFLLSSHVDMEKRAPTAHIRLGRGHQPRFVFLQHGVTQNDLSQWMKDKRIDLIIAGTQPEYDAFISEKYSYPFTRISVAAAGFPRWDRLSLEQTPESGNPRDRVLLMPTWRQHIARELQEIPSLVDRAQYLASSSYMRGWIELARTLEQQLPAGIQPLLVVHPSLARLIDMQSFNVTCNITDYAHIDAQDEINRSVYIITDYSSIAFDAAYAGVPVAYLQRPDDSIYGGQHTTRPGYFCYENDGFGPVFDNFPDLEEFLASQDVLSLQTALQPCQTFADRAASTFFVRDHDNCRRVIEAIESYDRRKLLRSTF